MTFFKKKIINALLYVFFFRIIFIFRLIFILSFILFGEPILNDIYLLIILYAFNF